MDAAAIFALIEKGLSLIPILLEAGQEITTLVSNMQAVAESAKTGSVTDDQLNELETQLDAAIAQFNEPMDPAQG